MARFRISLSALLVLSAAENIGWADPTRQSVNGVVFRADFESPEWYRAWGDRTSDPRTDTVAEDAAGGFVPLRGKALRIRVDEGGHYGTSLSLKLKELLGDEPEEIYFRYYLRFAADWNPERGGKLPGVAGTYGQAGWGGRPVDGTDGWSARGLFLGRSDGRTPIGFYCYHADMRGRYGSNWLWDEQQLGRLANNRWYCIEQYARMNTPGKNDGILRAWVDRQLAFEKTDVRFRDVSRLKIETIWLNVYYGGTWSAPETYHLYIDEVAVSHRPIGPLRSWERPVIDGDWWSVAGQPDLGAYTSEKQQPVDFAIWQASDGTWQIWSCIRHTLCGGNTRLFYRWEGQNLRDVDWQPMGIAMEADTTLGETQGGLQAPYVFREGDIYYMVYGDWQRICLARSSDGKTFERVLQQDGEPALFSGPYQNSRDPMILKIGELYYCYYMGHQKDATYESAIFCRTSHDLRAWSEPMLVSAGGTAAKQSNWYGGDAECPFVVQKGDLFYLFRNQLYGRNNLNTQYASPNPLYFGVGHDGYRIGSLPVAAPEIFEADGQWFIAALKPGLDGIRIARLKWEDR